MVSNNDIKILLEQIKEEQAATRSDISQSRIVHDETLAKVTAVQVDLATTT